MSKSLANAWFDAFRDKDIDKLDLAEDFVHSSPYGEIKGGTTYLDMVRANADMFFSNTIEIRDVIDNGDKCAVRYTINGLPACDVIYGHGGTVSRVCSYFHVGEKPTF